jgi:hypothetical protein
MKNPGLIKKLSNMFSPSKDHDPQGYRIYVSCNRCGEKISTRVDLSNDLSPDYGDEGKAIIYYCRKVLMGQKMCFQRVEVHLKFNEARQLLEREISGGKFIDKEEFLDLEE